MLTVALPSSGPDTHKKPSYTQLWSEQKPDPTADEDWNTTSNEGIRATWVLDSNLCAGKFLDGVEKNGPSCCTFPFVTCPTPHCHADSPGKQMLVEELQRVQGELQRMMPPFTREWWWGMFLGPTFNDNAIRWWGWFVIYNITKHFPFSKLPPGAVVLKQFGVAGSSELFPNTCDQALWTGHPEPQQLSLSIPGWLWGILRLWNRVPKPRGARHGGSLL